MKLIMIVVLLFLLGCTTEKIIYHTNHTIELREVEVIKEVTIPCPGKVCPECKNTTLCEDKLTKCNIRSDFLNDELYKCMLSNTSSFSENLTIEYDKCVREKEEYKNKLDNITSYLN